MTANQVVEAVADALDQLQIPFMLVGSFSSNYYGVARATQDADLVLQLGNQSISELARLLGTGFRLDPQMSFETVTSTFRYKVQHPATSFTIELFLLSDDPHDQARFQRRVPAPLERRNVFLPTPEDVVVMKLRWSKSGRRRKDVDDVLNVLAVQQGQLDLPYIRDWCDRHGTRELLERLLVEAAV